MKLSLYDKVVQGLHHARQHNSSVMVKPEVILWPDPEKQWASVIPELQKTFPALLIYGPYDVAIKQGPAIWLKCMVAQTLPEADWKATETAIIYLPGISKTDLRSVQKAGLEFQPLIEYQYTGTVFTQENGREWTIMAFLQNPVSGMGIKVAQDNATKDALVKALPTIFQDQDVLYGRSTIDAEYLNNHQFPAIIPEILSWMCKGDKVLEAMDAGKKAVFFDLCKNQYDFEPDYKNIKAIAEKLGSQRNAWKYVWQHYANAPKKYSELEELLQLAKPDDLGKGMFAYPEESWPQVNKEKEAELSRALQAVAAMHPKEATTQLTALEQQHAVRRIWVWAELGQAPLACAVQYLQQMAKEAQEAFPFLTIEDLKNYYTGSGFGIDQAMRKSMAAVVSDKDKQVIKSVIATIYKPWLENITNKFQALVIKDDSIFTNQLPFLETEKFILFVDAFRYELAVEFAERMLKKKYKVELQSAWSAIPSLTPTAKPNISPFTKVISTISPFKEFRPTLQSGKELLTPVFRDTLDGNNFIFLTSGKAVDPDKNHWQEIGDIDTKGHEEQADMVKRIEELFDLVQEKIEIAFQAGIKKIKIVTDHGWLLLPGGLPKTELKKELTETRWGRCALIKEGAKTDLLHLPWRWNPAIHIAYAPGISFFKMNEEYAHGGISIHECLVPTLIIENPNSADSNPKILAEKWVSLRCIVNTDGVPDGYTIDIRSKYNDEKTSLIRGANTTIKENRASVIADGDAEGQSATIVLLGEEGRILDKQLTTVGG